MPLQPAQGCFHTLRKTPKSQLGMVCTPFVPAGNQRNQSGETSLSKKTKQKTRQTIQISPQKNLAIELSSGHLPSDREVLGSVSGTVERKV